MSKIAILGDTHFSLKHDSLTFTEHQTKFYNDVFFPYLRENDITDIIQTGDFFDTRKHLNIKAIRHCKDVFLDVIKNEGFNLTTYAGNHDLYFKDTNRLYSVQEVISKEEYPTIRVIQDLVEDDNGLAYIPWINRENRDEFLEWADNTNCEIAFGHFEFAGFDFMKGIEKGHVFEEDDEFTSKVRALHQDLAKENGWRVINANQSKEEVEKDIFKEIKKGL